jgi:hypothetical protein
LHGQCIGLALTHRLYRIFAQPVQVEQGDVLRSGHNGIPLSA